MLDPDQLLHDVEEMGNLRGAAWDPLKAATNLAEAVQATRLPGVDPPREAHSDEAPRVSRKVRLPGARSPPPPRLPLAPEPSVEDPVHVPETPRRPHAELRHRDRTHGGYTSAYLPRRVSRYLAELLEGQRIGPSAALAEAVSSVMASKGRLELDPERTHGPCKRFRLSEEVRSQLDLWLREDPSRSVGEVIRSVLRFWISSGGHGKTP